MDRTPVSFQTALRKWAEERRSQADGLPDPEELVAYLERRLAPEARPALREKLALRPETAREFLDLASFKRLQPPTEEHRLSDREVEDALASIQARIVRERKKQDRDRPRREEDRFALGDSNPR